MRISIIMRSVYRKRKGVMRERRHYRRFELTDTGILLFTIEGQEINGKIIDISEESIGIDIDMADKMKLAGYGSFKFQFVDRYTQGARQKIKVITAMAIIIRSNDNDDGTCHIGCIVRDRGFHQYAVKRKFSSYYNRHILDDEQK